ncbi:MAG: putative lipoprotein [Crocinitomicaceae bacterium]|jgi:predicted lipoprotein
MRLKNSKKYMFLIVACFSMASSCKKPPVEVPDFDKAELLDNVASNLIVPSLNDFDSKLNVLKASFDVFEADRTLANLEVVRTDWKAAYSAWQSTKIYDFGPVYDNGFKRATGTFPSDTTLIQDNIFNGGYNLASASNIDAIGLSALDYLLYQATALNDFVNKESYTVYTSELISKMVSESLIVKSSWTSYKGTFVASTGTETTSAFSLLINEFNKDYELSKNAKLGIPLGKQSLGIQLPEYIEARNSAYSLDLLRQSMVGLQGLYNGDINSPSGSGVGFHEYLIQLERADLANDINSKFNSIISKIDSFQNSLEVEMGSNEAELDALYNLIHQQVVSLKTDMTSAFGVLITYQDNDGD